MHKEDEITIEVDTTYEDLVEILEKNNFKLIDELYYNDIYMVNSADKELSDYSKLLNKRVLIRNVIEDDNKAFLAYKHKTYDKDGNLIKQTGMSCQDESIEKIKMLLENLGYEELIRIYDHILVFASETDEIAVQKVNNKHLYIEIEKEGHHTKHNYASFADMKNVFSKYGIPMKGDNFFVKKAEIELKEKYSNN